MTLVQSRYRAPTPPAGYFRQLTASVLGTALGRAGTTVCAPVSEFEAEFPAGALSAVLHDLHALGGTPEPPVMGTTRCRLRGLIPTAEVDTLEQRLPGLTQGQGVLTSRPAGYQPVNGTPPRR